MDASIRDTSGTYQPWVDKVEIEQQEGDENSGPKEIAFRDTIRPILLDGPLNLGLLCAPISLISYFANGPSEVTFVFGLIALAPMAERLSFVTEQVAIHTNETIAGLLNVTFGNAVEMIVSTSALARGLYRLVQLSLLGSILSNMLLVLGCALWAGGVYHSEQKFGTISSQMNATLLMLAVTGISLPTILTFTNEESKLGELGYSRGTSLMLFFLYFGFVYFQLYSHKHLYDDDKPAKEQAKVVVQNTSYSALSHQSSHPEGSGDSPASDVEAPAPSSQVAAAAAEAGNAEGVSKHGSDSGSADDDDDEEEDVLGLRNATIWLAFMTVLISFLSDAICATVEEAAENMGISKIFTAAIIIPIVGNASEHAGAVLFAIKGKLDLTLGVAIGSSTQIALCVLPLMVILGWMMDHGLSLNFGAFEASTMLLSVISVTFAIKDGTSNWLLGLTLVITYFVVALGFWAHSNDDLDEKLR